MMFPNKVLQKLQFRFEKIFNNEVHNRRIDSVFLLIAVISIVVGFCLRSHWFSTGGITVAWIVLCIYGVKIKSNANTALDVDNTRALRGVSAIEIMLGHIGISTGNIMQFPNRKAGILFVGIFFVISGYGLAYGFDRKEDYLSSFFIKRLPVIIIPVAIVIFIEALYYKTLSIIFVIEGSARWYITELLVLYLVFYFAYRIYGSKGWIAVMIISAMLILIAFSLRLSNPWYGSTMCFPLGMIYYNYQKRSIALNIVKRLVITSSLLFFSALSIIGFFVYEDSFFGNVICRTTASVFFCSALLLLLEVVQIGNTFSLALAAISYEIYLLHSLIINILSRFEAVKMVSFNFTILVVIFSIISAMLLHYILIHHKLHS